MGVNEAMELLLGTSPRFPYRQVLEAWYDDPSIPRYEPNLIKDLGRVKTAKAAQSHVGGSLSAPSKMPGPSYSVDPKACHTGSKLRDVEGSVCSICYGQKKNSNYHRFPMVGKALCNRLQSLVDPLWVPSMIKLVRSQASDGWFRWHDVGDLQSLSHLFNIICVVKATPNIQHWLPTKEVALVRKMKDELGEFPPNLTVRVSRAMIGDVRPYPDFPSAHALSGEEEIPPDLKVCPAPGQEGECKDCRYCWDKNVKQVGYPRH